MSPWNDAALAYLKKKLKLSVILSTGLIDMLENVAGGFMSREEVRMVQEQSSNSKQMDIVIDILRGKGDDDFHCFCKILRGSNNKVWADELERNAAERGKKGTCVIKAIMLRDTATQPSCHAIFALSTCIIVPLYMYLTSSSVYAHNAY